MKNKNTQKIQKKLEKKRIKRAEKAKSKRLSAATIQADSQKKVNALSELLSMLPKECNFCNSPFDSNEPDALDKWHASFREGEIIYRCPSCENV